jgi:glucose-fructose oxidoreductase
MVVTWAILGLGEVAERSVGPGLALAKGSALRSVCSRNADTARSFAARFGARGAYGSLEEMLADPELDAVYIATPNDLHAAQTILAANAGKHVLCEKPMATFVADAERMIAACAANNVKLGVVFQHRYHPAHFRARETVAAGALGEIQFASAQLCRGFERGHWQGWRNDPAVSGSGAIVAQGVHPIDLLRFILGTEVIRVQAMTDEMPPKRPLEEMLYALLEFSNGAHASVVAGSLLPRYDNNVKIYGSEAKIALNGTLVVPRAEQEGELNVEGDIAAGSRIMFPALTGPHKLAAMIEDFTRCIVEDKEPQISGRNGLQMVKIADALQQSSRSGRSVQIA